MRKVEQQQPDEEEEENPSYQQERGSAGVGKSSWTNITRERSHPQPSDSDIYISLSRGSP